MTLSPVKAAAVAALFVLAAAMPRAVLAEDLVITLYNDSSYDIMAFYTSPSDVESWEEDVLGVDVLLSGESLDVDIADGRDQCVYDMRFELSSGDIFEDRGIDLCQTESYTLAD
jgi:hypothetical protein